MSKTKKLQFTLSLDPALEKEWDILNQEYDVLDNASKIRMAIKNTARMIKKSKVKNISATLSDSEKAQLSDFDIQLWLADFAEADKKEADKNMLQIWNDNLKK